MFIINTHLQSHHKNERERAKLESAIMESKFMLRHDTFISQRLKLLRFLGLHRKKKFYFLSCDASNFSIKKFLCLQWDYDLNNIHILNKTQHARQCNDENRELS